jgi:hypothetical protein
MQSCPFQVVHRFQLDVHGYMWKSATLRLGISEQRLSQPHSLCQAYLEMVVLVRYRTVQ